MRMTYPKIDLQEQGNPCMRKILDTYSAARKFSAVND